MENKPLTQEGFLALFKNTRFRYIHDVEKGRAVQGNNILDLSWNKMGYGAFFSVNGFPPDGKADKSRLLSLNGNYVDFDVDASLSQEEKSMLIQDALMAGIDAGIPTPTVINRTQKGAHPIWIYPEPLDPTPENIEKWEDVQKRLVKFFKGDEAAKDTTRVLRVPYTLHLKDPDNPFEIKVISYKPDAKCTLDELDAVLPKLPVEDKSSARIDWNEFTSSPILEGGRNDAATRYAGKLLHDLSPELWQTAGWSSLQTWNRNVVTPPLDEKELRAVFESVAKMQAQSRQERQKKKNNEPQIVSVGAKAITVRMSDVKSEPISWLWPGRIALGKLTLIAGDPGLGKSLWTADMAAKVSKGYTWPLQNEAAPMGSVILLSAEDDPGDTIKPRLEAAEADCGHIHILKAVRATDEDGNPVERMFSLKSDLAVLERLLPTLPDCQLIIIDPISAYLEDTDSHNNTDVRGLLAPLAKLASDYKVAIVMVQHLNKNASGSALYRSMGSIAFVAAARAAYIVTKDQNDPERRLVMPVKNNLAKDNTGLAYSVHAADNGAPAIAWEMEPVTMTADEALSPSDSNEEKTDTEWAMEVLKIVLATGSKPFKEVEAEIKKAGVKDKAFRSARQKLGVITKKSDFKGGWVLELPTGEDALQNEEALSFNEGTLGAEGHLRDDAADLIIEEELL